MAGVAFYFTHRLNTIVGIGTCREFKYQALATYRTQIPPPALERLMSLREASRQGLRRVFKVLAPGPGRRGG